VSVQGTSALVIEVPQAEQLVGPFRTRYDPVAPLGMPAHVTVLFPFVDVNDITEQLLADLWELFSEIPRFTFTLRRLGQFEQVLFLVPEPREPLDRLIASTRERYPDYPPYGGAVEEPDPHLTIAHSDDPSELRRICDEVQAVVSGAVIKVEVSEVSLMTHEDGKWRRRQVFPLAEMPAPTGHVDAGADRTRG
jgi:2'-5' RNA ligase